MLGEDAQDEVLTSEQAAAMLSQLTAKHIEVLELLALRMTTKEIARELGIAPNTVDQRLKVVRGKWGTTGRNDTGRRYIELRVICGKTTYGSLDVDTSSPTLDDVPGLSSGDEMYAPIDSGPSNTAAVRRPRRERAFGLQGIDERFGMSSRVVMGFVIAAAIAITVAAMLAIAESIGKLL